MCIRFKKLRSQKRLGLLFCLALSAMAASRGGPARPVIAPAIADATLLTPAAPQSSAPLAIAMASNE